MNSDQIFHRMQDVFTKSLGLESKVDYSNLAYNQIPEWDSIAHMTLVSDIESEFDIMLDSADVIALNTFPKALELVAKYLP